MIMAATQGEGEHLSNATSVSNGERAYTYIHTYNTILYYYTILYYLLIVTVSVVPMDMKGLSWEENPTLKQRPTESRFVANLRKK